MGFIAEKSEDIHLDNVDVRLRDGTDRMVTTTADATHFCNCRGKVIIENCLFENMLDDAANVHGTYLKVDRILSGNKVLAKLNHRQQFGYDFADAGDRIRIVDAVSILPKAEVSVTSYRQINEVYAEISFSDDIKDDIAVGDGLENISWYPELYFRNNIVRNTPVPSKRMLAAPKKRRLFSILSELRWMAYCTAPPIPKPVPAACIKAVMGYATLIAARALSPKAFPTKKPSAMA